MSSIHESIRKRRIRTVQQSIDELDQKVSFFRESVQNMEEDARTSAGFMGDTKFLSEKQSPVVDEIQEMVDGKEFTGTYAKHKI